MYTITKIIIIIERCYILLLLLIMHFKTFFFFYRILILNDILFMIGLNMKLYEIVLILKKIPRCRGNLIINTIEYSTLDIGRRLK